MILHTLLELDAVELYTELALSTVEMDRVYQPLGLPLQSDFSLPLGFHSLKICFEGHSFCLEH